MSEEPLPLNQIARERAYQAVFTTIVTGRNQVAALVLRDLSRENLTELHVICGDVRIMIEAERHRRGVAEGSG
jgi:hypothetical protein